MSASAISVQVKRLEARIGRPLFVRGHRSVRLSETGARLAPRLTAVFAELDRILADEIGPANDTVEISAMPSFAATWLAPRLADFDARPGALRTRLVGLDRLVDFDREGIDVGIRYGPGGYAPLHAERLADARAFPVCSPAFRAAHADALSTPDGLLHLPLLADETSLQTERLPNWPLWLSAAGVSPPTRFSGPVFESLHLALSAAAAGRGVALGLTPLVDDDLKSGALVRLFEVELPSPYAFWFVCRTDRLRERKIRAFRNWIFEAMARDDWRCGQPG